MKNRCCFSAQELLSWGGMKILDVPQTGSVGEIVTYQSRYGIIRRRKVIPRDPRTGPQLDRRTAFQRARSFWGTLTDEQFLAWNTLARTRQTHPVLGESSDLSGYELAVQINVHLATVGLPMVPTPSPVPVFPANPVLGLNIANIGGDVSLKLPLSAQPAQYIVVLGARPQSPGVSFVDHYTILGLLPDPEGGVCDITDLFLAKFHLLPVGKRIFIQTVQQINGWRDLPQTISARIPAQ
jgi:hypothetical protein